MKVFAKGLRNIHVRLRMDNTIAIAYLNHMGGMRSQSLAQCMCIVIMAMVFAEGYNHLSRISAGSEEHQSRCGIPNSSLIGRVDAASIALSVDNASHGAMSSVFVCYTPQQL